jgi:hypothetical protein
MQAPSPPRTSFEITHLIASADNRDLRRTRLGEASDGRLGHALASGLCRYAPRLFNRIQVGLMGWLTLLLVLLAVAALVGITWIHFGRR